MGHSVPSGVDPDDDVCLCFHVSLSKLISFARRTRPTVPSQMSSCHGAGTGCGWCRPQLAIIQAEVLKVTDMDEILAHDVLKTPGLVIGGKLVSSGRIPTTATIAEWIRAA